MAEVLFNYKGIETILECNINDKMKIIKDIFISKNKINKHVYFIYKDMKINEEFTFEEQANEMDNKRKRMDILVYDNFDSNILKENIIMSKEIICPECKENIFINIKDYRINLTECKNKHTRNNILLQDFKNTQKKDLFKLKCEECKGKSIENSIINDFYICNSCDKKLCKACKETHNNTHNIINYNDKNYKCKEHNKNFIKYCKECEENICKLCEDKHKNHNYIKLGDILIKKDELLKEKNEFKDIIDKLSYNIKEIKIMLDTVLNNIKIYYNIIEDIINNYDKKTINFIY